MMVTYDGICEKLGFDAITYKGETRDTEYDGDKKNPFDILSVEELDFLMDYLKENLKSM